MKTQTSASRKQTVSRAGNEQACAARRHAARRGSQSAYKAGQRRSMRDGGGKGSEAIPTNQQSSPKSSLRRRPK
jgi:hypothetical protein